MVTFRKYSTEDKESCLSIFDSNCPGFFAPEERQDLVEWLDKPDRLDYWVVLVDDQIRGSGGIYYDVEKSMAGFAWGMIVASHHGKGLGRSLSEFRLEQLDRLFPDIQHKLETSQFTRDFYAKLGFVEKDRIENGFGEGFDKVIMYREV